MADPAGLQEEKTEGLLDCNHEEVWLRDCGKYRVGLRIPPFPPRSPVFVLLARRVVQRVEGACM